MTRQWFSRARYARRVSPPTPRSRFRPRLEFLEERACPAVNFSGALNLLPGDHWTITAVLSTSDPNENGEGEPLKIQVGGGTYTVSGYFQTTTFSGTQGPTSASAVRVSAFIQGADGDEDATVSVSVDNSHKPRFTPEEKDAFNRLSAEKNIEAARWAKVAAAFGGVAAVGTGVAVFTSPTGVGAAIGGGLAFGGAGAAAYFGYLSAEAWLQSAEYQKLALDPPDPNFTSVAQPNLLPLVLSFQPAQPQLASQLATFNALFANEQAELGYAQALNTAINRASGAQLAGDQASLALQNQAIGQFRIQLANTLAAQPALLAAAQAALPTLIGSPTFTPSDIFTFEAGVQRNGLPDIVTKLLMLNGASAADITTFANEAFVQDTTRVAGNAFALLTDPTALAAEQSVAIGLRQVGGVTSGLIAVGTESGLPVVNVFDGKSGKLLLSFFAFDPSFTGGVRVAVGDVTGQGVPDIVCAAGPGGAPHVKVFRSTDGALLASFFAYDLNFAGGVNLALADLTGSGVENIVTGAGPGGGPHVKVFNGKDGSLVRSFFAYDFNFTGGVRVTAGDVNGDGTPDLVTTPDFGGSPHVKVFSGKDTSLLLSFFPYPLDFTGGVRVAIGTVTGTNSPSLITAPGPGLAPLVEVFSGQTGALQLGFFAYDPAFAGGVTLAVGDVTGNGPAAIVTGTGTGGEPDVKVFSGQNGSVLQEFFAYDVGVTSGVEPLVGDVTGSGTPAILTITGPGGGPHVKVFNGKDNSLLLSFFAFDPVFSNGMFVGM